MTSDPVIGTGCHGSRPPLASQSACQFQLGDDLCLDARRAIWLPEQQALAVADLHLGYAWAKRAAGQLLPVGGADDAVPRLVALQNHYRGREIILLGDIVHGGVDLPAVHAELEGLVSALGPKCRLRWVIGNHDRGLARLLIERGLAQVWRIKSPLDLTSCCTATTLSYYRRAQPLGALDALSWATSILSSGSGTE